MSSEPVSPAPRALGWDGGIFPGLTPRAMGDHPIRGLLSRVSWGVAGVRGEWMWRESRSKTGGGGGGGVGLTLFEFGCWL